MRYWRRLLWLLGDLILPQSCPGCDRTLLAGEGPWCLACSEALLGATRADYCSRCGLAVGPHLRDDAGCRACRNQANPLDGIARVGPYNGPVGRLVRRYKYAGRQRLDRPLGSLLADAIAGRPWASEIDGLVPVPTDWRSKLQYGFSPAGLIAASAGRELSLPALPLLYVRGKKRRQVGLSLSERAGNVRGVFHVRHAARVMGRTLVVIDDVSTSGSTLREVARVLKHAGAARVYAAALAKTDPNEQYARNA